MFDGLAGLGGQRSNGAERGRFVGELIRGVGEASTGRVGGVAFPAGQSADIGELFVGVFDRGDALGERRFQHLQRELVPPADIG
ncbi:hypothetical protein [Nocardia cyriacigeorgica]|uniref:hypothetical protein n=1 Tax=Nocardia cyriacigeorgica TaxID=135487 RepID=UPI002455ABDF|nr:hypothetical protein [Nocardia cyriacigeorgica]